MLIMVVSFAISAALKSSKAKFSELFILFLIYTRELVSEHV